MIFVKDFAQFFKTSTSDSSKHASRYLQGLLTEAPRKNMEVMDRHLGAEQYENTQHFISASPWSAAAVFEGIARRAAQRLGDHRHAILIIDESGHTKKGGKSCCVARQYNGRLGKKDNCQVGVYSVLNSGTHSVLIGAELYLPKEWADDPERCRKAGIPPERIALGLQGKAEIAMGLIDNALRAGVRFGCVGADAFYGRASAFRAHLERLGLTYCVDVPANTNVFTHQPPTAGGRPKPIKEHTTTVAEIGGGFLADTATPGHRIELREGENGLVGARVWTQRVWDWPPDAAQPEELWLIIRRMGNGEMKYSLSNAAPATSTGQLAIWQAGRFYVERALQDAKSHAGMSEYQCRGWLAWHHHMAMVCLATLFMTEERLAGALGMELLSAHDIVEMLNWAFAKHRSEGEMIDLINGRHRQRAKNAANAVKRKRKPPAQ